MTNVELDYVHQESYRLKDILRRRGVLEPFVALAIDVLNHQTVQMERRTDPVTRAFRDISKNRDYEFRREGRVWTYACQSFLRSRNVSMVSEYSY
jgi:hypothetical protein